MMTTLRCNHCGHPNHESICTRCYNRLMGIDRQSRRESSGRTIEITVPEDVSVVCPNCRGSGHDPNTMVCVMCGGDGRLEG